MKKFYKIYSLIFISALIVLSIVFVFILINKNKSDNVNPEDRSKLSYIIEDLENKNPNYRDNQLVRANMVKELEIKIDSVSKLNYFDDIPLKVRSIKDNPHGKGALVQLYSDNYNGLNFDVIGFTDIEKAALIKENEKYFVKGNVLKKLNNTETYLIVPETFYSPEMDIKKDDDNEFFYDFNLGVFLMEINDFTIKTN